MGDRKVCFFDEKDGVPIVCVNSFEDNVENFIPCDARCDWYIKHVRDMNSNKPKEIFDIL